MNGSPPVGCRGGAPVESKQNSNLKFMKCRKAIVGIPVVAVCVTHFKRRAFLCHMSQTSFLRRLAVSGMKYVITAA